MERWRFGDPSLVCERMQEMEQRAYERSPQGRREAAKDGLRQLFNEDGMGRKLNIPGRVTAALFQWGQWARRPQFWVNLSATPFYKLVGLGGGREMPEIKLDPQSMAVHKAVMRVQCKKTEIILYAYYVAQVAWGDHSQRFIEAGISEPTFHRLLRSGSLGVFNSSKVGNSLDEGITM